jgi:tetratricopeptide (TPR) repeat protein
MKFKPVYLYGILALVSIAILIFISIQESPSPGKNQINNEQMMPEDNIHKNLMKEGTESPSKENVSEEYKKKLAELQVAVQKNPHDTTAIKKYADYLAASHKIDESIKYYQKILELNPNRSDIYFALAVVYYNKQDFNKCDEMNNKVLSYDPKNQMALYNLGAVAATKGNKEQAKDYWNRVISIDSGSETGMLAKESISKL